VVVCVVFNPFTYDAQIIYVSDTIINALTYAREIAKKLLEKEKFKGYKAERRREHVRCVGLRR